MYGIVILFNAQTRMWAAMIEIIPNGYSIFVHFTVGLFITGVGFYLAAFLFASLRVFPNTITKELVARCCLWI